MSDFDKEAEREKLRKKYERDEEEREATQRMSDLLLKGATMTNAHCGTCGDPLFQQDGTTFCPSCHGNPDAVQGTDLEARPADESVDEEGDGTETPDGSAAERTAEPTPADPRDRQSSDARVTDDSSAADASTGSSDSSTATDATTTDDSSTATESQPRATASDRDAARRSTGDERRSAPRRTSASQPSDGDLEAAHDSLVRTLEKFAGEAAATDDPRYAKECLEAAREASETLETLR